MYRILKKIWIFTLRGLLFFVVWCGNTSSVDSELDISVFDFSLTYNGNVNLEKVYLNDTDLSEILELYQETWSKVEYKDSLLIAQKYDQWLWINSFVQHNLDTLEVQWLLLDNIKKYQILLNKDWKEVNSVLVEYEILEWFISTVPVLYMSQLFIPENNWVILISYMTENSSARSYASKMFKNIK